MPPRSVKMKRFIFGFQRRVWWPKWTPASRSSFMETTGMGAPFFGWVALQPAGSRRDRSTAGHRPPRSFRRVEGLERRNGSEKGLEIGRQRRLQVEALARERMLEAEPGGVQELTVEATRGDAVDRVAGDGQVDRCQVDADLVHPAGLEPHPQERVVGEEAVDLEMG